MFGNGKQTIKMSSGNKYYLATVIILLVASLLVINIQKARGVTSSGIKLDKLPLKIEEWEGKELEIPKDVYEILETKDIIIRQYKDKKGDSVFLAVVYSGSKRNSFHPPEICYLGGGAQLLEKGEEQIPLRKTGFLKTNKLVMKNSRGIIKAWYWFTTGKEFVSNYYLQQLHLLLDALRGREPKGALIRVSIEGNSPVLENKAKSFIKEVVFNLKKSFKLASFPTPKKGKNPIVAKIAE
jgi:EpsI family protein